MPNVLFDVKVADYQFKTIVNESALPKRFVVGEGDVPECVEFAARQLGSGGSAVLKLTDGALPGGRPSGNLTVEVELVHWEHSCKGPGDAGWAGIKTVMEERLLAEEFLQLADSARGQIEVPGKLKTDWNMEVVINGHAKEVKQNSLCAIRRFRRAAKWLESISDNTPLVKKEKSHVFAGLAKALLLQERQFDKASGPSVKSLPVLQAKTLALKACEADPQDAEAQAIAGFAYTELGDFDKATACINKALELDPQNKSAKSELARVNMKVKDGALQESDKIFRDKKEKLDAAVKKGDAGQIKALITDIKELIEANKVSWTTFTSSKVGKTIGELRKKPPKGDKDVAAAAEEMNGKLLAFTDRKCRQWI